MRNASRRIKDTVYIRIKKRNGTEFDVAIDPDDLPLVSTYPSWRTIKGRCGRLVVASWWPSETATITLLHRLVNETPSGKECKFLDGDPLNCRKSNLLNTDHKTVSALHGKKKRNRTGEANIYVATTKKRGYCVNFNFCGIRHYLGTFETLEEAVKVRDQFRNNARKQIKEGKES